MCIKPVRGFTLVELVLGLVVFAAISASFYAVLVRIGASSADPVVQTQAIYIARAYLDEALLRAPGGGCQGPPRDEWIGIGAYGCINDEAPTTPQNLPIPDLSDYSVSVAVAPVTLGGTNLTQVDVTVTHSNAPINLQLTGYRGN